VVYKISKKGINKKDVLKRREVNSSHKENG